MHHVFGFAATVAKVPTSGQPIIYASVEWQAVVRTCEQTWNIDVGSWMFGTRAVAKCSKPKFVSVILNQICYGKHTQTCCLLCKWMIVEFWSVCSPSLQCSASVCFSLLHFSSRYFILAHVPHFPFEFLNDVEIYFWLVLLFNVVSQARWRVGSFAALWVTFH